MSGKPITKQQVNLYMSYRKDHKQTAAAAQSGMSERTARRIESGQHSTTHLPRVYRTRKDPFNGAFEEHLVPLLKTDPELKPITLLVEPEEFTSTPTNLVNKLDIGGHF